MKMAKFQGSGKCLNQLWVRVSGCLQLHEASCRLPGRHVTLLLTVNIQITVNTKLSLMDRRISIQWRASSGSSAQVSFAHPQELSKV